jgi:hypothetical protein
MKMIVLMFVAITSLSQLYAHAVGGQEGNGGDGIGIEFKMIGFALLERVGKSDTVIFSSVLMEQLKRGLSAAIIESTELPLEVKGAQKDAINYPELHKIVIYRPHWITMPMQIKKTLILHELIGLLRFDDSHYLYSLLLADTETAPAAESSCETPAGKAAIAEEYVRSGGPVPACGPSCAENFILSQVCEENAPKASCYTSLGRDLKIREYIQAGNPVPACGDKCARDFILSVACPH